MQLFLVRHGETKENVAHIFMGHNHGVLTEKGIEQAQETAGVLKNYKFDHIYSSDLNRCVDTAEIIKEFHPDTPITFTKELRERHLGVFQGKKADSVNWDSLPGDEDNRKPEGGESPAELKVRVLNFIEELYKRHPDQKILLITHNGWMAHIISKFSGLPYKEVFGKIKNAEVFEIEVGPNLTGKIL